MEDTGDAIAGWDAFAENIPELEKLDISICCYVSLHPRLKRCDRYDSQETRGIASLYHMFTCLPGYHASSPKWPINYTDILTPAIKEKLDLLESRSKSE